MLLVRTAKILMALADSPSLSFPYADNQGNSNLFSTVVSEAHLVQVLQGRIKIALSAGLTKVPLVRGKAQGYDRKIPR